VIGLWRKSATHGDETTVRSSELAARARRLELKARRLVDGRALGAYDSVFRGHGIEFSEVRAYQSGDPFSSIDWKVTARMGRPFVKRFVEERELTVLLIVDVSPSTEFGTRRRLKRELAYEVAGVLALAAARNNDRVGLLLFTDRVERFLPPIRGRGRVLCLLYELLRFRPEGKETDLDAALDAANRYLKVRSLIFVISDFLGEKPERALRAAAGRHDVVAIEIHDPAEFDLPRSGLVEVENPETGVREIADLADAGMRRRLRGMAEEQRQETKRGIRRSGVDQIELQTNASYAPELAAFFGARARARRR
jgi:uncharacterized protein (DUF58 family)